MTKRTSFLGGTFLVNIIQSGLKIWVRSQCKSIEGLNIKLNTTTSNLTDGKLSDAYIFAREINFKDLLFNHIEIISGPMSFSLGLSSKKQLLSLDKAFTITGNLSFREDDLKGILFSSSWEWIGSLLSKDQLNSSPIIDIHIKDNLLECITYCSIKKAQESTLLSLKESEGTILIQNKEKSKSTSIPMDSAVKIKAVTIIDEKIILSGTAKVSP